MDQGTFRHPSTAATPEQARPGAPATGPRLKDPPHHSRQHRLYAGRNRREPFAPRSCLIDMPEQPTSELALSRLVDAELVRLAREGSVSALRLIVRRHNQRLYRVARGACRKLWKWPRKWLDRIGPSEGNPA
jgi:hypothetical protein